jgi:HSP20 family protein
MTLVRWDPFRELVTMSDRLNRMLAEPSTLAREGEPYGTWVPPVDIFEKDDTLFLRAELPGMRKEDIDLRIENGVLTLTGERRRDEVLTRATGHRLERMYGTFTRSFTLPTTVDAGRIAASYRDGVLEIQLPKSEASKPKRVEIRTA